MDSLGDLLNRMGKNTSQENIPQSSNTGPTINDKVGVCSICGKQAICGNLGVISYDVPIEHEYFGKLFRCPNNPIERDTERLERLRKLSNLEAYTDKGFNNFEVDLPGLTLLEINSLQAALNTAQSFANDPDGWLLLGGTYGCGKTHLAAAVGNIRLQKGDYVIFITVPDLLDYLRSTFGPSSEVGYDETFDRVREVKLLILDDLGSENPSQWAQEKLFQILNHRYSHKLPTIITTNVNLDKLDPRIRSRLLDENIIRRIEITAPDYRTNRANEQNQIGSNLGYYRDMTFENFDTHTKLTTEERQNLQYVFDLATRYAQNPHGWLILSGPYGSGKTHLAAAIANHYQDRGKKLMFVTVPDLLDYLRFAFNPGASVSFDQRFHIVRNTPLLILDDLGTENATPWAKEKLFQIIDHRYAAQLPTVITTSKQLEDLDPRLRTRLIDTRRCVIVAITCPDYPSRINRSKS